MWRLEIEARRPLLLLLLVDELDVWFCGSTAELTLSGEAW